MKKYLSHLTAALEWNIPKLDVVFGKEDVDKRRNRQIIDITLVDQHMRSTKSEYIYHSCKKTLPRGAVVKKDDIFIASPELVFLELANELDIQRLILLGLQMCSHSPSNASEGITTKRKLKDFLGKTPGHYGHVKAERAIRFIENGSNSIMESILFMVLTLPYRLGGYGLSGTSFNHEVFLDSNSQRQLEQMRCYIDLYYTRSKIAIEYDSFKHHNTPAEQGKDSLRASALKRQGIDVIQMTTIQLYNEIACEDFVIDLASRLGKRLKHRTSDFQNTHSGLRKLLPSQERNNGAKSSKPS